MVQHEDNEKQSDTKLDNTMNALAFGIPNAIGIFLYIPLMLAVLMSFGAPGSGDNWTNWLIALTTGALGPLCLIGLIFRRWRHWGLVGYGVAFGGWYVVFFSCGGKFSCG